MTVYFINNQDSAFYQSDIFTSILGYVQANPKACKMKETGGKLTLTFYAILTVVDALQRLQTILK